MNPQSPKTSAPCTLPVEPAAATPLPNNQAAATDEARPQVAANTESATIIREQNRLMPMANMSRIMRQVLRPPYAKISDDAKEVIHECVSEFISFITGEPNEQCHAEHRKTVTSEDIVWAMNHFGFDDYMAPISTFLQRMRDSKGHEERGPGRGSRRGSSLVVLPPLNNGASYWHPHQGVPPAAAALRPPVLRPVLFPAGGGAAAPHFGGRSYQQMYWCDQHHPAMVPRYGGGAAAFVVQAGGSSQHVGFHADEASSSNEIPSTGRAAGSH